jgi:hypothetical protein
MLRRVIELVTVVAVTAGVMMSGAAAAQAADGWRCADFPGQSSDFRRELKYCSDVETFVIGGVKYAKGYGDVTIGSLWVTSATGCKISTWLTLSAGGNPWTAPAGAKPYSICTPALTNRDTRYHGPAYTTTTTATKVQSTTCVDLFFGGSPTPGFTKCVTSPAVGW